LSPIESPYIYSCGSLRRFYFLIYASFTVSTFVDFYKCLGRGHYPSCHPLRRVWRSGAAKNFVREGPVNDVVSHWRRLESDCSFL